MRNKITVYFAAILFSSSVLTAQVQVSKEPRHKKVLENKYIRLLDVWLQPGDTTMFHIHSTPSVFLQFTNTAIGTQLKGQDWVKDQSVAGNASYNSFSPEIRIHRVSNWDSVPFHVTDIEILSPYNPGQELKPLPFTVLFENERAVAYQLTNAAFNQKIISNRGPIIAELVSGNEIVFHDTMGKKSTKIKTGKYFYIKPGSSFYFSAEENEPINLVLFEIK
jgi:hypothetical protein